MSPDDRFSIPAEDEASLWAARLDGGTLSESDRAELERWLAGDPGRRGLLEGFERLSAGLDRLLPALAAEGRVEMPAPRAAARPAWRPGWIAGALAAAAAVAAVVWIEWPGRPEQISAPIAQRRSFTLSDGTRVELNANTSISVMEKRAERRVGLADGEAYFEVTKDKARPFIVETPLGTVRVTGTRFNVRELAHSELVVTVVEGSVQVRCGDGAAAQSAAGPVVLGAGDRLVADDSGVTVTALPKSSLDDALAWRDGWIVFRGTPLSKALAELNRYYGRSITVTDSAAGVKLNTRFHLEDDLDGVLAALEVSLPEVRVERQADGSARVSLRGER
jgi:transmembrane sensor